MRPEKKLNVKESFIKKLLDEKRVLEDRIGQCAPSVRDFLRG